MADLSRKPQMAPPGKSNRWLWAHGWERVWVKPDPRNGHGNRNYELWIPPVQLAKMNDTKLGDHPEKTLLLDKDLMLRIYLIWHHLKKRRPSLKRISYSFTRFVRELLADLEETSELLHEICIYDQTEALRAFDETKGIRGEQLRLLDIARGKYLASQAAREPDPIA